MRTEFLVLFFVFAFAGFACSSKVAHGNLVDIESPLIRASSKVNFEQLKPILEKCQPCHFSGGKVYDKLPFDRPETIKTLGTKLFSRIRDERERQLIREFLNS